MVLQMTTTTGCVAMIEAAGQEMSDDNSAVTPYLYRLITLYSGQAEKMMNRTCTTATYTEYFDVRPLMGRFSLKAFPVTGISSVVSDATRAYSTGSVASTYYTYTADSGLLTIDGYSLSTGPDALRVIYRGGMAPTTASFRTSYPDLAAAIEEQVAYHWSRRASLGRTGESAGGGNVSWQGPIGWLKHVKEAFTPYRRLWVG